ncbi:MAG: hypothetical protein KME17_14770 [Cyanosarcina radialis HA8281-LM2]|nr:hypothetical protein [Cyanosarcina radialis HA8281-LM2]
MKPAIGNLHHELGSILPTPSGGTNNSHYTLWLRVDSQPWLVFQAINFN